MKLPEIAKIRILALVSILVGEIITAMYFYGQRLHQPHGHGRFLAILFLFAVGTPLALAALWLDWIRRRRVPFYHVFLVDAMAVFAFSSWTKGERVYAAIFGVMFTGFAVSVALRLLRHIGAREHEASLKSLSAEVNKLGPIAKNSTGLVVWVGLTAWSWSRAQHPMSQTQHLMQIWAFVLISLPAFWFASRLIFHLVVKLRSNRELNTSEPNN